MTRSIVFLVDQVQDVNILRPLLGLARQASNADISVLASAMFYRRDTTLLWQTELREMCGRHEIPIFNFASEFEAVSFLQGSRGLLISSAESKASRERQRPEQVRSRKSSRNGTQRGLNVVSRCVVPTRPRTRSFRALPRACKCSSGWPSVPRLCTAE